MVAGGEAEVRSLLPRTWHAFYGRFGRLREVQRLAAGPVVGGADVLVGAPTASGKTEALLAPLLERVLALGGEGDGPRVLVVSPTRALVNDLARRLEGPVGRLGIAVGRKHGDLARGPSARLEEVLITTPESLDSLLARGPRRLRGVRAVVLDELHLLHGTARGDQLRVLLERLERVAATRPQRCGATATGGRGARLARDFLGDGAEVLGCGGQREIAARLRYGSSQGEVVAAVGDALQSRAAVKLLVFANRRSEVEALGAALSALGALRGRVFVHHGSLARDARELTEARFGAERGGVCVATTTLEIGVDIGDVDGVVLVAPPPDVRSLLQRAGRGNRGSGVTRVLGLYGSEMERLRFEHLLECAREGRLFEEEVPFRPNVAAQQALSLLMQSPRGWVGAGALAARLPAGELTEGECAAVLGAMAEAGVLREISGGRFVIDAEGERLAERGKIHSMIRDHAETEVVDALTGRKLGTARLSRKERERAGEGAGLSLSLGGRRREVARVAGDRVYVDTREGADAARFIAREVPRYTAGLAADLGRFLGAGPGEMWLEPLAEEGWRLHHFLGSAWGVVLDAMLRAAGYKGKGAGKGGPFATTLTRELAGGKLPFGDGDAVEVAARRAARGRVKALARVLGLGAHAGLVPAELTERWVDEAVDVGALAVRLREVQVVARPDPEGE